MVRCGRCRNGRDAGGVRLDGHVVGADRDSHRARIAHHSPRVGAPRDHRSPGRAGPVDGGQSAFRRRADAAPRPGSRPPAQAVVAGPAALRHDPHLFGFAAAARLPFDQGLGDLFVARVAGNIVDPALLGSVEYAVGHLKTPLIVVIGHEKCGAVQATLESIQHHQTPHGDIGALVTAITPAVAVAEQRPGDLLDNTIRANAEQSLDAIKKSSELTGPLAAGQLKAIAAYYSIDDGRISLI